MGATQDWKTSVDQRFPRALDSLWKKDRAFKEAELSYEKVRQQRLAEHQLTADEYNAIAEKQWANGIINWINGLNILAILLGRLVKPFIRLLVGAQLYKDKSSALSREDYLSRYEPSPEKVLEREDQDLLHSVKNVGKQIEAAKRNYEFVAITLLDGRSFDDQVVLGSPIYIADNYKP